MKNAQRHFSTCRISTCRTLTELAAVAEAWRASRITNATTEWSLYETQALENNQALVIAPSRWDGAAGQFLRAHYTIDCVTGVCNCPDQTRIAGFGRKIEALGGTWENIGGPLLCKHVHVCAIHRIAAQQEAAQPTQPVSTAIIQQIDTIADPLADLGPDDGTYGWYLARQNAEFRHLQRQMFVEGQVDRVAGLWQ